jgi:hypothetical protein
MNLPKIFNSLKALKKKNSDAYEMLPEIISKFAEYKFKGSSTVELQISRHYWGTPWIVYVNKKGKRISAGRYFSLEKNIYLENIDREIDKVRPEYTETYDYKIYEKHIQRLNQVSDFFKGLGFKTKSYYSKDYKKRSLAEEPESIWLSLKY